MIRIVSYYLLFDEVMTNRIIFLAGMDVVTDLQKQLVQNHRAVHGCGLTLYDLRRAALRHPEIAFWVKYNRARQGQLKVGDAAPPVPLFCPGDAAETTTWFSSTGKMVVVFAGSLS